MSTAYVTCTLCHFEFSMAEEQLLDAMDLDEPLGKLTCPGCMRYFSPTDTDDREEGYHSEGAVGYEDPSKNTEQREFDKLKDQLRGAGKGLA